MTLKDFVMRNKIFFALILSDNAVKEKPVEMVCGKYLEILAREILQCCKPNLMERFWWELRRNVDSGGFT